MSIAYVISRGTITTVLVTPDDSGEHPQEIWPRVYSQFGSGGWRGGQRREHPSASTLPALLRGSSHAVPTKWGYFRVSPEDRKSMECGAVPHEFLERARSYAVGATLLTAEPPNEVFRRVWDRMLACHPGLRDQIDNHHRKTPPESENNPVTETEPEIHDGYISRTLAGGVQDFALLEYAMKQQQNVLLYGPTQSGKTSLPMAFAKHKGLKCVTISGDAAMDPNELFGHRTLVDGTAGYEENHVTDVIRTGGLLIIDEINMLSMKIVSPLFSLLDHRREVRIRDKGGEVVKAHPELLVVATMNVRYAGTMAMSEALLDRFAHRHEWGYDPNVEAKLVPSAKLRELFTKARSRSEIDTPLSTSLMMQFSSDLTALGFDYAMTNMASRAMDPEERAVITNLLQTYKAGILEDHQTPEEKEAARREREAATSARVMRAEAMRAPSNTPAFDKAVFEKLIPAEAPPLQEVVYKMGPRPRDVSRLPDPGTVPNARAPWDDDLLIPN